MSKKMGHQSATFRFKMGILDEPNCHFYTNRYKTTGNLYVAIMDAEGSPYIHEDAGEDDHGAGHSDGAECDEGWLH